VKELVDIERSAETVAEEIPVLKRGTNPQVLQGRWLRHAVEAIEQVTAQKIETKANDSAGKNFRLIGADGEAFEDYCRLVDRRIARRTMVTAVRAFHAHGGRGPAA
jgi:hypothetical protein